MASEYSTPVSFGMTGSHEPAAPGKALDPNRPTSQHSRGELPAVNHRVHKSPTQHTDHGGGGALHDYDWVTPVRQGSTLAAIPSVEARGRVDDAIAARHIGTRNGVLVPNVPGSDFCAAGMRPLSDPSVDLGGDAVGWLVATFSQAHRRFGQDLEAIRARLSPPRSDAVRHLVSASADRRQDHLTTIDDSQDEGRDAPRYP